MYYYHFTHYAGHDRVFYHDQLWGQPGDLLRYEQEWLLVLGEEVAWPEQYTKHLQVKENSSLQPQVMIAGVLSAKSLHLLHRMVGHRFTSYKNTIPLRFNQIEELVKRVPSAVIQGKKTRKKAVHLPISLVERKIIWNDRAQSGQQLIVFPDLWTLEVLIGEAKGAGTAPFTLLHSQSTAKQKAETFRGIHTGKIGSLVCTYSQLFQDWQDLSSIVLIDHHKRYYKSQQDPRYYVPTVVDQLAKITGATVQKIGISLI